MDNVGKLPCAFSYQWFRIDCVEQSWAHLSANLNLNIDSSVSSNEEYLCTCSWM